MNTIGAFLVSQTVLIPLAIGLIRYRRMVASYQPFLLLLLLAFISETISFICIEVLHTGNAIPSNLYELAECIVILAQFYAWGSLQKNRLLYYLLGSLLAGTWITENLLYGKLGTFSPVFRVAYAFIIVLMSINEMNHTIVQENRNLLKNAKFLINTGFITYFIYQIIYEASFFVGSDNSLIAIRIISVFLYINAFVNLIYAVAVYYIPVKDEYYFQRHFDI